MSISENGNETEHICSFCGKAQAQVGRLIAGQNRVFICDLCIGICDEIVSEHNVDSSDAGPGNIQPILPRDVHKHLDGYVIGQERAKKILSVAVYNHYKRVAGSMNGDADVEVQKSNILLMGPTGSGKTLLAQTLARVLDVPFCISDATSLTEAGYVGEDVENILLRLIQAADYDVARAERGIIYIDEIDKIARKNPNPSITRDVSGEGVQQALLKIIEGTIANVPPQGGRKHPQQEYISINTDGILFICGGSFEGLESIVEKRLSSGRRSIGFKAASDEIDGQEVTDILKNVSTDDLLDYGFIPELIGRLPVMVALEGLDKPTLMRVLTEPKNALVKQYHYLFGLDGVDLVFMDDALEAVAEEALKRKTGARALRTMIEEVLLDIMYDLPSLPDVGKCVIDGDTVRGLKRPQLLNTAGSLWEERRTA